MGERCDWCWRKIGMARDKTQSWWMQSTSLKFVLHNCRHSYQRDNINSRINFALFDSNGCESKMEPTQDLILLLMWGTSCCQFELVDLHLCKNQLIRNKTRRHQFRLVRRWFIRQNKRWERDHRAPNVHIYSTDNFTFSVYRGSADSQSSQLWPFSLFSFCLNWKK